MPRKSDTEHEMLNLIVGMGDEGILQSELWKKMNGSYRKKKRIA
jgi:hypothetical protein